MYKGTLLPTIVQALVRMVEKGVDDRPEKASALSRALLTASELIYELRGPEEEKCIVAIGSNGTGGQLAIGMLMSPDQARELSASVDRKNAMSPMERSRKYREGLLAKANGQPAPGLGLLDLLRSGGGVVQCAEQEMVQGSFVTLSDFTRSAVNGWRRSLFGAVAGSPFLAAPKPDPWIPHRTTYL